MVVTVYLFFYLHSFDCILTVQSDHLSFRHILTVVVDFQPLGKITKNRLQQILQKREKEGCAIIAPAQTCQLL